MYKPCGHFVLVKLDKFEVKTKSGIILATPEQEKREQKGQCVGTVIAFGPNCYKGFHGCNSPEEWGVSVGDRFETQRYAGIELHQEGYEDYRIILDEEIKTIIKED